MHFPPTHTLETRVHFIYIVCNDKHVTIIVYFLQILTSVLVEILAALEDV